MRSTAALFQQFLWKGGLRLRSLRRIRRKDLLPVLLLTVCLFPMVCRCAYAQGSSGMDVILVLDTSGSMKYTDPGNRTAEAALLFLNMMEENGSRAGILAFSDEIRSLRPLVPLHMEKEEEEIRTLLAGQERDGDTDLGAAADSALAMAQENTAILFFTDGMVDLPDEAEKARSLKQAKEAARKASGKNVTFFCIALDDRANQSEYHPDRELLQELAEQTGGSFRCVEDAQELPELFHLVFSDFIESRSKRIGDLRGGPEGEQELSFVIPDQSVLEANVILLPADGEEELQKTASQPQESASHMQESASDSQAEQLDVRLLRPDGKEVPAGEGIRICRSSGYTLLKLFEPLPGEWRLSVSAQEQYHVHVNLLLHYELELLCEARQAETGTADVWIRFRRDGDVLEDEQLYRQMNCRICLEREEAPQVWEEGLDTELAVPFDAEEGCFHTQIPVYPGSSVRIAAEASGDALSCKADVLRFTSRESDAIIVDRLPERISLEGLFPKDAAAVMETSGLFHSWDGSAVPAGVRSGDEEVLLVRQEAEGAVLQGMKSGTCELILTAEDRFGVRKECAIPVQIRIHWERLRILLAAGAGGTACAAAAVLLLIRRKRHGMKGLVLLNEEPFSGEEEGTAFPLQGYRGAVSLEQVIRDAGDGGWTGRQDENDAGVLLGRWPEEHREQILAALAEVTLQGMARSRKGQRIRLKNRSRNAALFDCYGKMVRDTVLFDQDTFEIRVRGGGALYGCCDMKE